jgi:signal transduction histidine kinase
VETPVETKGARAFSAMHWGRWLALAVVAIACLDLTGWIAHIRILTSVLPGYATMKPNTAICLALLALAAVWRMRSRPDERPRRFWAADLAAGMTFLLAAMTWAEVALRANFGIDTLLIAVAPDRYGDPAGRMSPGTAVCLTLCALALLLTDRLPRVSLALVLSVSAIALSGLIGFLFGAGPLFGVPMLRSLAVHTALCLLLVQLAVLMARPEREPVRSLLSHHHYYGGRRSWLLPGVTIVPTLVALPLVLGMRLDFFDAAFAMAMLVVLLTGIQTMILWQDSAALRELEERRQQAEQALLQSEKLAVVGRLAASISHEINNPLEAVGNLLYLVREADSQEVAREYALAAEKELSRVSQITSQTLSFYRETRRAANYSAREIVESAMKLLSTRIAASGVLVECEFAREPDELHCRDGELRQVLINLISNALEATPPGGRLRVRTRLTHRWDEARVPGVCISIADTGCGMAREVQRKIFEPFFTTKQETGNGLGLWVAKDLIAKQGGTVQVRSSTREGRSGTVFSLLLPLAAEAA